MTSIPFGMARTPDRIRAGTGRTQGVWTWNVAAIVSAALLATDLWVGPHVESAGLRSAIETAIMLSGLLGAILLGVRFQQTRLLRDLLLLSTLATVAVADFGLNGLPAFSNSHAPSHEIGARATLMVVVAVSFLAVALAPARRRLLAGSRLPVMIAPAGIGLVAVAVAVDTIAGPVAPSGYASVIRVVAIVASAAMVLAGIRFLTQRVPGRVETELLAGASFLLAGAWLQKLVWPAVAPDWVTLGDLGRLAAYGLLLATALHLYGRTREHQARAAINAERLRIASDLHDGLAQDLAFIAAHSDRLAAELGAEHPLAIAAQRALAVARREMVDLSASDAPDVEGALRKVAAELAARFAIAVEVVVDDRDDLDMTMSERTELVRIAREAIVNAVARGGAQNVTVRVCSRRSDLLLRVSDDGCGIGAPEARARGGVGLGLQLMRARARRLGGDLVTHTPAGGGTQVDVVATRSGARSV